MEMVERVARAICAKSECGPGPYDDDQQRWIGDHWIDWEHEARAAIVAMREPTEAMIAIGIDEAESCTDGWTASAPCVAEHMWPAMIDAALT